MKIVREKCKNCSDVFCNQRKGRACDSRNDRYDPALCVRLALLASIATSLVSIFFKLG